MYDPPAYLSAMIIGGIAAIAATTCLALYGGAVRAAWAEGAPRCSPGPRPSCSAAGSPPAR